MKDEAYMKKYFANAKNDVLKKLEELVKFYDDWIKIYDTLDIPAPLTYKLHPTREHPTMNDVLAKTVGYDVICTEFKMALYNLIKQGVYQQGYESNNFKVTEVELSKKVENLSSSTKKYKPYFLNDIFNFKAEEYYDSNEICIEEEEDSQFGGGSSGNNCDLQVVLCVLKFIKLDLLPKYRDVEHIVHSSTHYIA